MPPLYILVYRARHYKPGQYQYLVYRNKKVLDKMVVRLKKQGFQVKVWRIKVTEFPPFED